MVHVCSYACLCLYIYIISLTLHDAIAPRYIIFGVADIILSATPKYKYVLM